MKDTIQEKGSQEVSKKEPGQKGGVIIAAMLGATLLATQVQAKDLLNQYNQEKSGLSASKGQKSIDKGGKLSLEEQLQSIQNEIDSIANSENPDYEKLGILEDKMSVIKRELMAKKDDVIKAEIAETAAETAETEKKIDIIRGMLSSK